MRAANTLLVCVAALSALADAAVKPAPLPPASSFRDVLGPAAQPLRVHMMTMPAHGHYMTLRDVGIALRLRGHDVTFVLCEGNREVFQRDGLPELGIRFLSAGDCSVYYEEQDAVMRRLLEHEDFDTVREVLGGVARLSHQMCSAVMPLYHAAAQLGVGHSAPAAAGASGNGTTATADEAASSPTRSLLPDVLVFDADTFCAQDVSIQFRIPRVARVGTGPRDTYQNPISVPQYGTALPLRMTTGQRLVNALSLLLSRWVVAPMILPRLMAAHRFSPEYAAVVPAEADFETAARVLAGPAAFAATGVPGGSAMSGAAGNASETAAVLPATGSVSTAGATRDPVDAERLHQHRDGPQLVRLPPFNQQLEGQGLGRRFHLDTFSPEVPWDGAPVLYNSHWGLEHARPLHPFEHMIGHTTDFSREEAKPIPEHVLRWLAGEGSVASGKAASDATAASAAGGDAAAVPVVYVGLGTLTILSQAFLQLLADSMAASACCRFIWVVPASQQHLLPESMRRYSAVWEAAGANGSSSSVVSVEGASEQGAELVYRKVDGGTADPLPAPAAGDVLLVNWAPQLALLRHSAVVAFWSHGGMNGVAEGTYAHTPFLCMPLFSDQPDNCQHLQDRGMGRRLNRQEVSPAAVEEALTGLLRRRSDHERALNAAWRANLAAGGIPRAVQVVEGAAGLGYEGSRLPFVPRHLQEPAQEGNRAGAGAAGGMAAGGDSVGISGVGDGHFMTWAQRHDLDVWGLLGGGALLLAWLVLACCRCCVRCCWRMGCSRAGRPVVDTKPAAAAGR